MSTENQQIEQAVTAAPEVSSIPKIEIIGFRDNSFNSNTGNITTTTSAGEAPVPVAEPQAAPVVNTEPEIKPEVTPVVPEATPKVEVPEQKVYDPYKELGFDESQKENVEKILTAFKTNKLDEFIQVKNTNYDSMSPEELIRIELKNNNPKANLKQLDLLHKQVLAQFNITDYDDESSADGRELYNLKAETIRDGLKSKQSEYTLPEYQAPQSAPPVDESAIKDQMIQMTQSNPHYKQFETNRIVTLGSGEETYNFEVPSTVDVMKMTVEPEAFASQFYDQNGQLDMQKWIKVLAYASNMEKVETALMGHGKTLKEKESFVQGTNPKPTMISASPESNEGIKVIGIRTQR